jgi:membrane protein DedA with SNARE-associated domain/rhodanese-related sulfurtransferase
MAHDIIALIAQHGLLMVFLSVLVDQAGAPLPSMPALVVAGALAASGKLSIAAILMVALAACLLCDLVWYWAGRHFGAAVIRTLCRISLSPDSCVRQSEVHFERWGGQMLLVAKFVPGLDAVAPPLMGAMRLPVHIFVLLDGLGSLLWAGVPVGLGYFFAAQVDTLLAALATAGTFAFELVLGLAALYVLRKWWRRRSLLVALRMARITVEELHRAMTDGRAPVVVDVRSKTSRRLDRRIVPGALLLELDHVGHALHDVPLDQELVIYCNCPNEASSASAAKALMARGYRHVRPLKGGLDAWGAAGYAVQWLPLATEVSSENVAGASA